MRLGLWPICKATRSFVIWVSVLALSCSFAENVGFVGAGVDWWLILNESIRSPIIIIRQQLWISHRYFCFDPDSIFVGSSVFIGGFIFPIFGVHPLFSEICPSLILGVWIAVNQAQGMLSHKLAVLLKQFGVFGQQPFLLTLQTPNPWVWSVCGELVNSRWAELYAP